MLSDVSGHLEYGIGASAINFNGKHRYIRITDISNWGKNEITSPSFIEKSAILNDGDILLARTGATVGDSFIYKDDGVESYFAGFLIRAKVQKANPYFVYYQLKTLKYAQWVKISSARSGQPGINSEQFGSYRICITEYNEQQKIANFLKAIDERIEAQNKIIEDLIALRNQINNVFFDSINTCVKFNELYITASEGGTPDTSKGEYYLNGTIPFIKIENLYEKYLFLSNSFISESGLQNSSAWLVPKESILLSNGATIGETTILKIDAATKQGILGIIPKKPYDSEILYYTFKSRRFAKILKRITTKGTMEAAYLKDLNKEKVFLTCDENMNSHVRLMSLIDEKIIAERQILNLLVKQKQYLLDNLFI